MHLHKCMCTLHLCNYTYTHANTYTHHTIHIHIHTHTEGGKKDTRKGLKEMSSHGLNLKYVQSLGF